MKKRIVLLGATGSIGRSTLRVVAQHPDQFEIIGMSGGSRAEALVTLGRKWGVTRLAIADEAAGRRAGVPAGAEAVEALARLPEADVVVVGIAGMAGYGPTLAAIGAGHDVALATKEVLVMAGTEVMAARAKAGVRLLPLDSEHSAIFQCLQSQQYEPACVRLTPGAVRAEERIHQVILTASGGPFWGQGPLDWKAITVEAALKHPRWSMGAKVTIDSATMMNKGLEMIEALHLFGLTPDQLAVWVHRQSVVHSCVAFKDGALLAQMGAADMALPIQYALTWPDRLSSSPVEMPTLAMMQGLTFDQPDLTRFPCLKLVVEALREGVWTHPILTLANEVAVKAFLAKKITADVIAACIEQCLEAGPGSFEEIVARATTYVAKRSIS